MYYVEINTPMGWLAMCNFSNPDDLEMAAAAARRFTLSSKCGSRVCEPDFGRFHGNVFVKPDQDLYIVYEYFYDRNNDPDARDDDPGWTYYNEENNISWQECGF